MHRDVSLHNILVGTAGAVKVIDFGIAKAHNRMQGETRTGVVKGKIHYMAPEQVQKARRVDRRVDVWALGVCLHELVTGKLPYDGEDDVEVIRKLMTDEPPPLVEGLPESVVRVLERSLVLDVDLRFPTAAAMQRALEAAMNEMGEATTSEDVAAFLRSELPELAQRRKGIVQKAVDEARDRAATSGETQVVEADVAFAPTVMSERQSAPSTRREGALAVEANAPDSGAPPHSQDQPRMAVDHAPGPGRRRSGGGPLACPGPGMAGAPGHRRGTGRSRDGRDRGGPERSRRRSAALRQRIRRGVSLRDRSAAPAAGDRVSERSAVPPRGRPDAPHLARRPRSVATRRRRRFRRVGHRARCGQRMVSLQACALDGRVGGSAGGSRASVRPGGSVL